MAQLLLSSKTIIQEEPPQIGTVPALPTSITAIVGVTERGPEEARLTTSKEEWTALYGRITANAQDVPLFVDGFYAAGGQFLWTKRVLAYGDITDPLTKQGDQSSVTLQTPGGLETSGFVDAGNAEPFVLDPGDTLVIDTDGGGNETGTFDAARATRAGAGLAIVDLTGDDLQLRIDGGALQTINFTGSEASAADVAATINGQLIGGFAVVNTGEVDISSDVLGTDSSVEIVGGTSLAEIGHSAGTDSGTGDVGNIKAVTLAEVKTVVEADTTGLTVVDAGLDAGGAANGIPRFKSDTTGSTSTVQIDASSTADGVSKFDLDNVVHAGTDSTPDDTLLVEGKWIGTYADAFDVEIEAATNGQADSFNLLLLENGFIRESFPNLKIGSANASDPRYVETVINNENTGSTLIQVTDLLSTVPAPNNKPAVGTSSMTGGDDGLTGLDDNDFIGDVVTETGLRGFDTVKGIRILCVPGRATAAVANATLDYAENVRNGEMFVVLDPPAGQTAQQIITYVESTASILESSEFGAIYWPRVKILNPNTEIFGNAENIVAAPSGIICGIYARTDASQLGGIYQPPAGIERGILTGVVGFETDAVLREAIRDLIFPKRINPLTTDDGLPRYIDGPLTLKSTGNFPTVAERRGVIHIEQSIKRGIEFARHSNNDEALRARVNRTARRFLIEQMRIGAFRSRNPAQAFFTDVGPGLNTEAARFSGKIFIRIGLATQKPALFVVMLVSQDTRALEEELAGAA